MRSSDSFLRATFLAAAVFGGASSVVLAADTQAAWQGFMQNTAASSICATMGAGGTGVGDTHVSVYRPHILSTDTTTYLSVVFLRAAFTLQNSSESKNPQMNGSGADTAIIIDGRGAAGTPAGTFSGIVVTPKPVLKTTNVVTMTGTIDSYFNVPGCNVTFKATYVKE